MTLLPNLRISKNSIEANQVCTKCGMPENEWRGNNGKGFQIAYKLYCCQGCAANKGCTCR